jgi:hypothetical protein
MSGVCDLNDRILAGERIEFEDADPMPRPDGLPDGEDLIAMVRRYPALRRAIIEGVLRVGELLNLVGASKTGKSWLVAMLVMAVALGREWLGFLCAPGRVLLLDFELHRETLAWRARRVMRALGVTEDELVGRVEVRALRGCQMTLARLEALLGDYKTDEFKLIVVDPLYKLLPGDAGAENDNAIMASIYATLEAFAERTGAALVLCHHSSKGEQGGKAATDVGSGAGSMVRACDSHIVLRRHEENGCAILEGVCRSWPAIAPRVLRFDQPLWREVPDLDPAAFWRPPRKAKSSDKDKAPPPRAWTSGDFAEEVVGKVPRTRVVILEDAQGLGMSNRQAGDLLKAAVGKQEAYQIQRGREVLYAAGTVPGALPFPGEGGAKP